MPPKALQSGIESLVMLAEAEAREMPGSDVWIVVEGAYRDGGDAGFDGDMAAEIFVASVESERPEIGRHEIRAVRWQQSEADIGQAGGQSIAFALQIAREVRIVTVAQTQPGRRAPLQIGGCREGEELVGLG